MSNIERRISRANWSTKQNTNKYAKPPKSTLPPITSEDASRSRLTISEPFPVPQMENKKYALHSSKQKKPHKIENHAVNRRFSVKVAPAEAPNFSSVDQPPQLPSGAKEMMLMNSSKRSDSEISKQMLADPRNAKISNTGSMLADLSSDNYEATSYVKKYLRDANAAKIDKFATDLTALSISNDNDVKIAITQSFNQVLQVSQAINSTEEILKEMKSSASQLSDVLSQQVEEAQDRLQSSKTSGTRDNRSSVMLLEKKWASNLNTLFKEVEGAQKFVSAIPGRHVLSDSKRWGELNVITWKPIRPAHLIILNDHVLVATRKRTEDKKRTIATQCWPVRDVTISDATRPSNQPSTDDNFTLTLKTTDQTFLFQTDSLSEYNKIKLSFRRAKDEINNIIETERAKQREYGNSLNRLSATHERMSRNSDFLHDISSQITHRRSRSADLRDNDGADFDSIEEDILNLEIRISHHRFEDSVGLINRLNEQIAAQLKLESDEQLRLLLQLKKLKVDNITERVVKLLSWEIENPLNSNREITEKVSLFSFLNLEDTARVTLLESKTNQLNQTVSKLKFEGDLSSYILQVSLIYFNFIKSTHQLYSQCFKDPNERIFIITWANEVMDSYNALFKRQLMDYNKTSETYLTCASIAKSQISQLERDGFNIDYMLQI